MEDLSRLLTRYTRKDPRIVVMPGIGKDATVISFADRYLVAKTDPITFATEQIGWYAVHINANDVAAMGGIPRWFLATLLLPEGKTSPREVEDMFAQISGACQELGVTLCGDTRKLPMDSTVRSWWVKCWAKWRRRNWSLQTKSARGMKSF